MPWGFPLYFFLALLMWHNNPARSLDEKLCYFFKISPKRIILQSICYEQLQTAIIVYFWTTLEAEKFEARKKSQKPTFLGLKDSIQRSCFESWRPKKCWLRAFSSSIHNFEAEKEFKMNFFYTGLLFFPALMKQKWKIRIFFSLGKIKFFFSLIHQTQ